MSRYYDDGGGVYAPPRDEPAAATPRLTGRRGGTRANGSGTRASTGRRAGGGGTGRPRRPRSGLPALGGSPALTWVVIVATVLVVAGSLFAYGLERNLADSIKHNNITAAMLGKRPPKLDGSVNILVIGSDSRRGTHGRYGKGIYGSRSDTSMLLHIAPNHKTALVVSFPRDSMVPVLQCLPDGKGHQGQQAAPGQSEMLNATYSAGGAACLWKTLEQTTHIHIDHYVEVNFSGFKAIVNDVHGVRVCLPFAIKDPASGLNLTAGVHTIGGGQALAFVRERHIGLGSDLQRIQRQQYFLASAMQKIKQMNVLGNPSTLYSVVHDVARSLTTDSGLTLSTMAGIAYSMRGLSSSGLQFISVPVVPDPTDPLNRVDWAQPQASQLFTAIAHDNRLSRAIRAAKRAHHRTSKPAATISPSRVRVDVLDGSGTDGVAHTAATGLASRGFDVIGTGNAASFSYTSTVIQYSSPSQLAAASTLKAQLGQVQLQQSTAVPPGTVDLILGSDFTGLPARHARAAKSGTSVNSLAKNYGGIKASTNICKDQSAFSGPDTPSMWGG